MSCRLYIGNLDKQVAEDDVKKLFSERDLTVENVLLKAGYAFVDCHDQATVDSAIDKLAGIVNTTNRKNLLFSLYLLTSKWKCHPGPVWLKITVPGGRRAH